MSDENEKDPKSGLTPVFSNRFQVVTNPNNTRIIFGDTLLGKDSNFHTSVAMPTEDAKELAKLILELIEKNGPPPKETKH